MEDRCYEKTCSGHGSCDANSGECRCAPGYTGADCANAGFFSGSRLITAEWGDNLNGWMKAKVKGKQWSLCFNSFTDDATTAKGVRAERARWRSGRGSRESERRGESHITHIIS